MGKPTIRFEGYTDDWEQRKFGEIVEKYEDPVETPTEGYTRLGIRSHAKGTFHSYVEKGKELETAKMFRVAADKFIVNITFGWEHAVAITDENDAGKLVSHRFPQYSFNAGMEPLTQSDKEQMFVDILPDIPEDDGCAYLTFYLDEDVDKQEMLLKVRQELEEMRSYLNVGECTIEESQTEDVDWVNNWKQYFHQFYIDDILVIPSWENVEAKDSDKMVIHIDPGTAFGTGMHETTQLCIRQLKKYVTEDTEILDVGCGSGILGMLALKFGAKHSVGTDLDPCAIDATYENMDNNGIGREQYEVMIGNIIDDKAVQDKVGYEKYDIVAANILADVLVPLTPVIIHQMKKGGIYITSGIIEDKEDVVVEAVKEAGLEVLEVNHQGEWVSVTARKN